MRMCMDWSGINFDWNRARAFLATAEEGSLSAAARVLGLTQPTVGRQVDALEKELGIALFERSGRGLTLTPGGLELLPHLRAMAEAAGRVSLASFGQSQELAGNVTISASEINAAIYLPPIIARLRRLAPAITVRIVTTNAPSDLYRREADIAIRNFRPSEPDLIARKIADIPGRLYATPAYLESIGTPRRPADLNRADFIDIGAGDELMNMLNKRGMTLRRRNFPLHSENFLVMWELVKHGLGIGVMDGHVGDADPLVVRALPEMAPIMFPTWLVAHRDLMSNVRLRLVFDLLARELGRI